jgi:uncharacterized protein (DUF952 family)
VDIYKIATVAQWRAAEAAGVFEGAPLDLTDGFIHFSTAAQVSETLAKHFAGQRELLLIAVSADQLGAELRWEVSRGGQLFPHLYAHLRVAAASSVSEIPVGADGRHVLDGLPIARAAASAPIASSSPGSAGDDPE